MQRPQGAPPEGMEPPEGVELPQDMQGFPVGEQEQKPEENTDNTQTENGQPTNGTSENGEQQQRQNTEQMTPPNMNFGGGNMPGGFDRNNMQAETESMTFIGFVKEYQTPIISVVLLLLAFVFVKLYKRKNY